MYCKPSPPLPISASVKLPPTHCCTHRPASRTSHGNLAIGAGPCSFWSIATPSISYVWLAGFRKALNSGVIASPGCCPPVPCRERPRSPKGSTRTRVMILSMSIRRCRVRESPGPISCVSASFYAAYPPLKPGIRLGMNGIVVRSQLSGLPGPHHHTTAAVRTLARR